MKMFRRICGGPDGEAGEAGQVRGDLCEGEGGLPGQYEGHPRLLRGELLVYIL